MTEIETLLLTKFIAPSVGSTYLERPHLEQKLYTGIQRKLTVISGPAGSGKTTLLSHWLQSNTRPLAWLSLDNRDNDQKRFWTYVITALQKLYPGLADHVLSLLTGQAVPRETVLIALINALTTLSEDTVIVLDDYHLIKAREIHGDLTFLLENLPPRLHLIIAGRSIPSLPIAGLRAQDQLTEVDITALRFSRTESEAFLCKVMGLQLSEEAIAQIIVYTEGWIVGLRLAALALQNNTMQLSTISAFQSNHRYILEYLTEEVFQYQMPEVQDFLLQSAILEHLNGNLCDYVLNRAGSHKLLQYLERNNIFLIPLDDKELWYRYHHLFAEFLNERLAQHYPERLPELHRRAAQWYAGDGSFAEAVKHALAANEPVYAIELLERIAPSMLKRYEVTSLLEWLDALPANVWKSSVRLALYRAWALLHTSQIDTIPSLLGEIAPMLEADQEQESVEALRGEIAAISARVAAFQGDTQQSILLSGEALKLLPIYNEQLRGEVSLNQGIAYLSSGDWKRAQQAFYDARQSSQRAGNTRTAMLATRYQGSLYVEQGKLRLAAEMYQEALNRTERSGEQTLPPLGYMLIGMGEVLYQWNDLPAAAEILQKGIEHGKRGGDVKIWLLGMIQLIYVKKALGEWDCANKLFAEAEQLVHQANFIRGMQWLVLEKRRMELGQGTCESARCWAEELDIDGEPDIRSEDDYQLLARLLMIQREPGKATILLQRLLGLAKATERNGRIIALLALYAMLLQAQQQPMQAAQTVEQALTLAEHEGYMRVFLDEGEPMARLLSRVRLLRQHGPASKGYSLQYIDRLLTAFERAKMPATGSIRSLVEPLSQRETEVLQCIAAGQSNEDIAKNLIVGMNTVKTHLKNIYSKLGVHSRTQAVARARALKLL